MTAGSKVNSYFLVEVPRPGGKLTEGAIGTPLFINPLLAISDVDKDLTRLVYSGLLRVGPDGRYLPDLAEKFELSEDGSRYTFTLKNNLYFHDGEPLESDDVAFTVNLAKDEAIKSPRRANWEGVTVETPDPKTVVFILRQPYAPFLENATLGILPKHLWKNIPANQFSFSTLNIEPVGSGPYQFAGAARNEDGAYLYHDFKAHKDFALGEPYINKIRIRYYGNEEEEVEAYRSGQIESAGSLSPSVAARIKEKGARLETANLPRVFGVFFNHNKAEIFANQAVRKALNLAVNRETIVKEVLAGFGQPLEGPIPRASAGFAPATPQTRDFEERLEEAKRILEEDGWKFDEETGVLTKLQKKKQKMNLEFTLSTSNSRELKQAAELLRDNWARLGARVELKFFEIGDLNQNVIRPRDYQALLFGEILGRFSDPFAFWHSSQRLDPGLNIAFYTNSSVDKMLESARTTTDEKERLQKLAEFQTEIEKDIPAVFLYSPDLIYLAPRKVRGIELGMISDSSERLLNIHRWYIYTDKIWKIFAD